MMCMSSQPTPSRWRLPAATAALAMTVATVFYQALPSTPSSPLRSVSQLF
jgi:hypothetical protein